MKRICLVALVSLWGIAVAGEGLCAEKAKASAPEAAKAVSPAKPHKAKARGGSFTGMVVWADPATKTVTIKGRGKIVTFDASNPTFRGFRRLEDLRQGSYVSVSYTSTGTRISRATRGEAASEPAPEGPAPAKAGKKASKSKIPRIQHKGIGFSDVDENKDGKVTAVELSTVISNLTIEQFKQYDKNGDGSLSEAEYGGALKNR